MRVQLNEFNIRLGRHCYLPLATGLLRAYAEQDPMIDAAYEFAPFLYHVDTVASIMRAYEQPVDVAAFSVSVWNEQLNLAVAAEVSQRWPGCLIIFGGLQVPDDATDYLRRYPFIDVAIRREGEAAFAEVLRRHVDGDDFRGIPQVTCRTVDGGIHYCPEDKEFKKDLHELPSPALMGLFDGLLALRGDDLEFSYVLETNRGCMYSCSFCEYGLGQHKLSYYGLDRVYGEIDWVGQNKIEYLLGADANFGLLPRDLEIAEYLVAAKKKYGCPDKFRVNYGKNSGDKIYKVGMLLHEADMTKGITLARQSNSPEALKAIKRANIKMSTYQELQTRFNDAGVPTYSEFIVGLPGETYESWVNGLDEVVAAGMKNQVLIYPLMALPNTDMGRKWYQEQYGIKTVRIELAEVHGTMRGADLVSEYEDIIISTSTMSTEDWRRAVIYSWVFGALYCMKLGYFIIVYLLDRHEVKPSELIQFILEETAAGWGGSVWHEELEQYNYTLDGVLDDGRPLATVLLDYGNVYWGGEEATFLRCADRLGVFYTELAALVRRLLRAKGVAVDVVEVNEVIEYQSLRVPRLAAKEEVSWAFGFNLHSYFESVFTSNPVPLMQGMQVVRAQPVDFDGNKQRYAREAVLFGRKSGKILVPVTCG